MEKVEYKSQTFTLDCDSLDKLKWLARVNTMNMSTVVRRMIREAYDRQMELEKSKRGFQFVLEK